MEHDWLTAEQAADYMQVSLRQLRELCQLSGLPHMKVKDKRQSHIRVRKSKLNEWMIAREVVQQFT